MEANKIYKRTFTMIIFILGLIFVLKNVPLITLNGSEIYIIILYICILYAITEVFHDNICKL